MALRSTERLRDKLSFLRINPAWNFAPLVLMIFGGTVWLLGQIRSWPVPPVNLSLPQKSANHRILAQKPKLPISNPVVSQSISIGGHVRIDNNGGPGIEENFSPTVAHESYHIEANGPGGTAIGKIGAINVGSQESGIKKVCLYCGTNDPKLPCEKSTSGAKPNADQ